MQFLVNETVLRATDRLYDAVAEAIAVLDQSPVHRLLALEGLRGKLRTAKAQYDETLLRNDPEAQR